MNGKDIAMIKALGGGGSGGSGGSVKVDSELSATSTNPVQNRVIKSALDAKPDVYIVTFSTDETGGVIIADKTYAEIASANEKMLVFGRMSLDGSNMWFSCAACDFENGAIFTNIGKRSGWKPYMLTLRVKPDGTVEFEMTDISIG